MSGRGPIQRYFAAVVLCACALFACAATYSLDRDLTLSQLNHRSWLARDLAPANVTALAQSPEGVLWLGTSHGLFWSDGLEFQPHASGGDFRLPSTNITALHASPDGSLWVGFRLGGVTRLHQRELTSFGEGEGFPAGAVHTITRGSAGTLWAATNGGLARFVDNRWHTIGTDWGLPAGAVLTALVDRQDTVWVATNDAVLTLPAGQKTFRLTWRLPRRIAAAGGFAAASDGSMWLSAEGLGLVRLDSRELSQPRRWFTDRQLGPILFDRDGHLWMAGDSLRRLAVPANFAELDDASVARGLEEFSRAQGLTSSSVRTVFEDREGNMWVGTTAGIDRLSPSDIVRVALPWPPDHATLVPGDDGSLWVGGSDAASLLRFEDGKLAAQLPSPAFSAGTRAPDGVVWFGGRDGVAKLKGGSLELTPLPEPVRGLDVQAMTADRSGALWVSMDEQAVFRLAHGVWSEYGNLAALPRSPVISAVTDERGDVWLGYTDNRLARVSGENVRVFTAADGLDVGAITALHAKDSLLWVGGELGLATLDGERFQQLRPASCQPFIAVSGIVETHRGDVWLFRGAGLTRIETARAQLTAENVERRVYCATYVRHEGLPGSAQQLRPTPSLVQAADGRVWLAATDGVAWINPDRMPRTAASPPTTILRINAGGTVYSTDEDFIRLPIHTQNLEIAYTAWSLRIPEQVRFRYWLEGSDPGWRVVGRERRAVYTNLGPGSYRFHVAASHDNETWSDSVATLDFEILPAFYQTNWFKALCVLIALLLLAVFFRVQMLRATARVRVRLEERMLERERIARELHDTLLQGLQGLIMRFHSVALRIPEREPLRDLMERALERADEVLIESRDKVKDLRDVSGGEKDLSEDIAENGRLFATDKKVDFSVTVHGSARDLHLIVREETFLITREALANAFTHAQAGRIEVELFYERGGLRVNVRDDGRGIDEDTLLAGRTGHWGLLGMRERAQKIGATLQIYSRANAGTELDLRIPAALAYNDRRLRKRWSWRAA